MPGVLVVNRRHEEMLLRQEEDVCGYRDWRKPDMEPARVGVFESYEPRLDPVYRELVKEMGRQRVQLAKAMVRFGTIDADGKSHPWTEIFKYLYPKAECTRAIVNTVRLMWVQERATQVLYDYLKEKKAHELEVDEEKRRAANAAVGIEDSSPVVGVEEYCRFLDKVFRDPSEQTVTRMRAGKESLTLRYPAAMKAATSEVVDSGDEGEVEVVFAEEDRGPIN